MQAAAATWTEEELMRFPHKRLTAVLDGEDVLPDFRLPLAELFAELSFE